MEKNIKSVKWKIIIFNILIIGNFKEFFFRKSICMCSIAKKENLYIKEFINHYKKLGYNHFFLYDNNDKDDEKFENVIFKELKEKIVTVIDFRGFRGSKGGPQMDAYYNCYKENKNKCDWISFFDIDEYLILDSNYNTLQQLLDNSRYENCEGISLNWKIFHDNNLLEYKNISIMKRFTGFKKNFSENTTKLIARGKLSDNLEKSYSAHTLWYDIKLCNTLGKRITYRFWTTPPSYNYAYLNHYYTKSIGEYCNKIKKGNVYYNITLNSHTLKKKFNLFFLINNKTKQKVNIFNKIFNTTFKLI